MAQEAQRRGMTQSELVRSLIARFPVPRDPVQNSSHTHAAHVRCGASFAGQLSIQLSAIGFGLWPRYGNGQKVMADRRRP
ncbi:hypothetical protein [Moorena sp. SIO4G3]|uniref:hypothetical protein n=1 Tax=Moorena sp. SIO4G3 TaxID=2607821 RepID=UPI00142A8F91|nr:hypothetical protein [Moorena sp. SIO4G3]NEO79355.1 hypothetical protein [Moorena sp. SIO4G3]